MGAPQKPDRPSPVQFHKRRGSGGLLSRPSVHTGERDEEDDGGGTRLWNEVVAYIVYWLGLRSAVYILQVGKVVGRSPRQDRAIQKIRK